MNQFKNIINKKSHKKRNIILGAIAVVLLAGLALRLGSSIGDKARERDSFKYVNKCSAQDNDDYQAVRGLINKDTPESLEEAKQKIASGDDHSKDPNCLLLSSFVDFRLGDIDGAQKSYDEFEALRSESKNEIFLSDLTLALIVSPETHKELIKNTKQSLEESSNNVQFSN